MEVLIGPALSNLNTTDLKFGKKIPRDFDWYMQQYEKIFSNNLSIVELQPEFSSGWIEYNHIKRCFLPKERNDWAKIINNVNVLGVHSPIYNVDVLHDDKFYQQQSIENIKQAMNYANHIRANYFVFHLVQVDRWNEVEYRRKQWEEESMTIYHFFADYYRQNQFNFVPLVEVLEYPKYPCSPIEIYSILNIAKEILPETRLCFDISHLWRSRGLIFDTVSNNSEQFKNVKETRYFVDELDQCLELLNFDDIYLWHLGGCYGTETHLIPGIYPNESPDEADFRLDKPDSFFDEYAEMNYNQVLKRIIGYSIKKAQPLRMILEIHYRSYDQILKALFEIRKAIENKIARGDWK